jgi:hypothetical protein
MPFWPHYPVRGPYSDKKLGFWALDTLKVVVLPYMTYGILSIAIPLDSPHNEPK